VQVAYSRVSSAEKRRIVRGIARGLSLREIGRRLRPRRDHKTVSLWASRLGVRTPEPKRGTQGSGYLFSGSASD
jgi:hypothetical protein